MKKLEYKIKIYFLEPFNTEERYFLKIEENGDISFVKEEEATTLFDKEKVEEILLDFFINRGKYKHMCKGSSYLSVRVVELLKKYTGGSLETVGDSLTIKF